MADAFDDWTGYKAILDEILYRDPSGPGRQLEVKDGVTRTGEIITFADGSRLAVFAEVPLPPLGDMTPTQVTFLKLNGERGQKLDDGSNEAMNLARQSIGIRFLERISRILDRMPEREKISCPACQGARYCLHCHGQGCSQCDDKGACQGCDGHGLIPNE